MSTTHAMSHVDAAWLALDQPANLMVITAVLWSGRPIDEAGLRQVVQERLVERYPRFSQRAVKSLTGTHWEDDEAFELDHHFHRFALPHPGDRSVLEWVVGDLAAQALDPALPLWAVHLLDGYGDGSAVVVRMHHAIADGLTLTRVLLGMTDSGDDVPPQEPQDTHADRSSLPLEGTVRGVARITGSVLHEATETLVRPGHVLDIASEVARDTQALIRLLGAPAEPRHPLHADLGVAWRAAWAPPLPLADVRAAAHRHGTTADELLVSAVAGALRPAMEAAGAEPQDVHAMLPFDLRAHDEALPRDLGNRFGIVMLDLPVSIADPLMRLEATADRMDAIKTSREGPVAHAVLGAAERAPVGVERRIVDAFSAKATTVMTAIHGPFRPVELAGAPVDGVLVWTPCSGAIGLRVSVFSYAGAVDVGFLVNGALLEDPAMLVDAFTAAAHALLTDGTQPHRGQA